MFKKIVLVGQSYGGLVSRYVGLRYPSLPIKAVISLATPAMTSPYLVDESVRRFYQSIETANYENARKDKTVILVCAGLRDELIPQQLCLDRSLGAAVRIDSQKTT